MANIPRPKFTPGELVRVVSDVPEENIDCTEIMARYYDDNVTRLELGTGQIKRSRGWVYRIAAVRALAHESMLRKLPPDERISWDGMLDDVHSGREVET